MQLRPEGQGQCDRPQVDHPPEDPGRFTIGDEFGCPGFNTDSFLRFFGGLGKSTPNVENLERAGTFARNLEQVRASGGSRIDCSAQRPEPAVNLCVSGSMGDCRNWHFSSSLVLWPDECCSSTQSGKPREARCRDDQSAGWHC